MSSSLFSEGVSFVIETQDPFAPINADPFDIAQRAAEQIASATGVPRHDIALVLGSGWAAGADGLGTLVATVSASDLLGFHRPAVAGHLGTVRSVRLPTGKHALIIGARTHFYEGLGVRRVVHGIRTAAATGASTVILTNGAGGIRRSWKPGTPVLIRDHINLTGASPLEGATFIDMTNLYSPRLRNIARRCMKGLDEGVYCQFRGPQYETPAEIQMAKAMGGHIVGMSTVLEAIAARQAGMEILGLSLITNHAAGIQKTPLSHQEVLDAGAAAEPVVARLLTSVTAAL